ncbi:hypothetical protein C8R48DRAFT_27692 [Suillus tomentosus]|nr:hypothetical protein C8R48DRAFT_27692 [Suillus tomentosus]
MFVHGTVILLLSMTSSQVQILYVPSTASIVIVVTGWIPSDGNGKPDCIDGSVDPTWTLLMVGSIRTRQMTRPVRPVRM